MTKCKIEPLGDKVAVVLDESEDISKGGIILPEASQKKPTMGTVYAVGPGRVLNDGSQNKLRVKEGDRVLFSKYGGNEVTIDGDDLTIIDEDQIYAIL